MKKVGLIVEYNPFHNGHLIHIENAKKLDKDTLLIAVVSGNYTQRGELSIISKWEKALLALNHGIDIVIELPLPYSIMSSDYFSYAAITTLNKLKVDTIIFGSETKNIKDLEDMVDKLINEDNEFFKKNLKLGFDTKKIINKLLTKEHILPNDTLAISYIKTIKENNFNIDYQTYKRDNNYLKSASNIRNSLGSENLLDLVPLDTANILKNKKEVNYFNYLKYKILSEKENIKDYLLVDEGIENKILKEIDKADSLDDLIEKLISKRYSKNKVKRTLLCILLSIKKEDKVLPNYIRVLGFNKKGQKYLKILNNKNIITNLKNNKDFELEISTDKLYCFLNNIDINSYLNKPIIKSND